MENASINNYIKRLPYVVLTFEIFVLATLIVSGWPEWWKNINYEVSPLNWFSSVQLAMIGTIAVFNFSIIGVCEPSASRDGRIDWLILGFAFWYLSYDEAFQFHERLRENFLKPHHIGAHLPGIAPGDFILIVYGIAGILFSYRFLSSHRQTSVSRNWMIIAMTLAASGVALDACDHSLRSNFVQRVLQFSEEITETLAQSGFLISFLISTMSLIKPCRHDNP